MRGPINPAGPRPLGDGRRLAPVTPAVYQEDPLFVAWCEACDELLAPIAAALDCFPAYLDPRLAPADFVAWLGALVGLDQEELVGSRTRDRVAEAAAGQEIRGTVAGLRAAVARAAAVPVEQVEVEEPGGVVWSSAPSSASPPVAGSQVRVVIRPPEAGPQAAEAALAAARRCVPMQYQAQVEVVVES
jgi:phage tail-like protein